MTQLIDSLSIQARTAPESGIVEVINAGREHEDLIPLWAGEGELPTPDFICNAAAQALRNGETFYTYQRGLPELREALATYHADLYGKPFNAERFFVTGSGMQAIQLAVQAVAEPGQEVIVPTPAWPNINAAVEIHGARATPVSMHRVDQDWSLDVAELEAAITPKTAAIFLNTPCNPTGWVASREVLADVLKLARRHGLWIIADEIYALFYYGEGRRAPSFHDVSDPQDRIIYTNSMSKNWAMTGWRVGWMSAPEELGQVIENLIQYSTSGVPAFSQRAALAALTEGGDFLEGQIRRAKAGRQCLLDGFKEHDRIQAASAQGAFYLFFSIDGIEDTRQFALQLVRETGVGLAPGTAFGKGGEKYLRLCYLRNLKSLNEAVHRICTWLPEI